MVNNPSPDRKVTFNDFYNDPRRVSGPAGFGGSAKDSGGQTSVGINDRRVRLSPKPAAVSSILGPDNSFNILQPLFQTSGLMFPYTPSIQETINVNYEMFDLVHSNQPIAAFKNVGDKVFQIAGAFTAMNDEEARYSLAAIHYLRTVTKMFFGVGGSAASKRGTPPPILLLNAYGTALFHNVPVIVTMATIEYPQDVDYVHVTPTQVRDFSVSNTGNTQSPSITNVQSPSIVNSIVNSVDYDAWIPTKFNISISVSVQNTPSRLRRFDLDEFRRGALIKKGGWV